MFLRKLLTGISILSLPLVMTGQGVTTPTAQSQASPAVRKTLSSRVDTLPAKGSQARPELILPRSLDVNLNKLMDDWHSGYASNRQRSEVPCINERPNVRNQSDSIIIERLRRLPTVIPIQYNPIIKESIATFLTDRSSLIRTMLTLGDYYFPIIEPILDQYKMPVELMYLTIVESALNPMAVSPAGASGLWQFMLPTGKIYGLEINSYVDERLDIRKSTAAAARYFTDMYELYGDWLLAIASYNCGPGNVNKAIRRSGGKTGFWEIYEYLPRETRNYIPLFMGVYYAMYYHKEYNICPREKSIILATDTLLIDNNLSFRAISDATGLSNEQIRMLNPQYKRGVVPGYSKPYTLRLPVKELGKVDALLDSLYTLTGDRVEVVENRDADKGEQVSESSPRRKGKGAYRTYTIRKGDSLSRIAASHGVSLSQLKRVNGIKSNKHKLKPGKKLKIPKR